MKRPSNELFLLIKSLSKSEKRYFRQYAERHTIGNKNNYLELFDAILTQEAYDEAALKNALAATSYHSHFAVAKRYLHQQILESLHLFHQNNSIQEKIKKQLHLCAILTQKGLFEQAKTAVQKAEKWISDYQLWEYLPTLVRAKRTISRNTQNLDLSNDTYTELELGLQKLQEINWYWQQNNIVRNLHYQKIQLQDETQQAELKNIITTLQKKGPPKQLQATLNYFKTLATAAFMNGASLEAYDYNKKALELFDNHANLITLEPQLYIASLNNFLIDNFTLKKYTVVESGIKKLRLLPQMAVFKSFPKLEAKIFELTYTLQLNARIAQSKFKEALELLPAIEEGILKYKNTLPLQYKLQFYYLMAYIVFFNEDYEQTLTYLDKIRNPKYHNVLEELVMAADRLYLITHFELGNYLFLDNLMTTIKRAHKKKNHLLLVEDLLFKSLKKIANPVLSQKERKTLFIQLQEQLNVLKKDNQEQRAWIYFDFDKWLSLKI